MRARVELESINEKQGKLQERLRGINHEEDDDRAEGTELNTGVARTVHLSEKTYGEKYEDADTNYKGTLPDTRADGTRVIVKAGDEWRNSFVEGSLTCDTLAKNMCGKCQKEVLKADKFAVARAARCVRTDT